MRKQFAFLFLLAAYTLPIAAYVNVSAGDAAPVAISPADHKTVIHDLAVGNDGSVNVVWVDRRSPVPEPPPAAAAGGHQGHGGPPAGPNYADLWFARSTDGGKTFNAPQSIAADKGADHAQVIALPNGEALLAWDARVGETRSVLMRKATMGKSVTFGEPMTVAAASYPALGVAANGMIYCSFVQSGRLMLQALNAW